MRPTLSGLARLFALATALLALVATAARGDVPVYTQAPNAAGGQFKSAWYAPDGLDGDEYVWDAFTLASNTAITQVQWRGAYTNYLSGAGLAPVYDFYVGIYPSIAGGFQPDIVGGPLVRYRVRGNAGETPAGIAGGVNMYDYHFTLPSPFQAAAGVKYWLYIVAWQGVTPQYGWPPDWSWARASSGDGSHFRRVTGGNYASIGGDCTFTLLASTLPTFTIDASASPAAAGTITGAGSYPSGSTATLRATPNTGWAFARWTENGAQVSTNPNYSFTVTANRTLVANFTAAYTVTTSSWPTYGGSTAGGGTFPVGTSVTVTATPAQGFVFWAWTEYGNPVSTNANYTFTASANRPLVANFMHAPNATTFNFDNAPRWTPLPISLTSDGLTAVFSGTGSSFSVQQVGELGIAPPGFEGLCLFPSSVFPADLIIDFDRPVADFSILYSTQELACDTSARMRVTGFLDGVQVGTNTTTAPVPGTWPSGTLTLAVAGGFNRAVVHYDAPPPAGCTDYGVIFLADNVTVTALCPAAGISANPVPVAGCSTGAAAFSVAADAPATSTYQWQVLDAGVWTPVAEGDNLLSDGRAFGAAGAASDTVLIGPASAASVIQLTQASFRCVVSSSCSATSAASTPAALTICRADSNCDGFLDFFDYDDFVFAFETGGPSADFNADGFLDFFDYDGFVTAFEAGC